MQNINILVVGFGNMATALVDGWLSNGMKKENVFVVGAGGASQKNASERGLFYTQNLKDIPEIGFDIVMFAVKPQMFPDVLPLYQSFFRENTVALSIAAGVEVKRISDWLKTSFIVRVMPNTPSLVGAGMSAIFSDDSVLVEKRDCIEMLMRSVGETLWLRDEDEMHAFTAICGCGPAYVFLMIEALVSAAEKYGFSRDVATKMAVQTVYGAGVLADKMSVHPTILRENVTSQKGVTAEALSVLFSDGFVELLQHAVVSGVSRSREMAS